MDNAFGLLIVAGVTLGFNIVSRFFDGGFSLSRRLTSLEMNVTVLQQEIRKLSDILVKMADFRGDLKVTDQRLTAADQRMAAIENDIRELRHGDGFIRGTRGIDREYP